MKLDKRLVITLIVLAVIFLGYKLMNFYYPKESSHTIVVDMDAIKVINEINLPYVNIYLYSDGKAYLVPIDKDEISKLESGNNLKDRLTTLYNNSTTLDKKYDNVDIKGYNVNLDDLVEKIYNVVVNEKSYIIFFRVHFFPSIQTNLIHILHLYSIYVFYKVFAYEKILSALQIMPEYYAEIPLRSIVRPLAKLPLTRELFVKMAVCVIAK